jgi:glutathione peroxidase
MKKISSLLILALSLSTFAISQSSIHTYNAVTIAGDTLPLSQFYGKKLMIVNTASFCAYTPQYDQLESLYTQYKQYNFEVIGFPTDDFGRQGGSDSEIINTCNSYNVTFPITEKINVNTAPVHPIYQWLKQLSLNGVSNASVTWNFNKFLIDEAGHWVRYYNQNTQPDDQSIIDWILSPSVTGVQNLSSENLLEIKSSNPATSSIDFILKKDGINKMTAQLFSSEGRLVTTLFEGIVSDSQAISYSVETLQSGIYFIKVQANGVQQTIRYSVAK